MRSAYPPKGMKSRAGNRLSGSKHQVRCSKVATHIKLTSVPGSDGPHLFHFRNEMAQQVLDTVLQGCR